MAAVTDDPWLAVRDLPDEFLDCHGQHKWDRTREFYPYQPTQEPGRRSLLLAEDYVCERCGKTKMLPYIVRKRRGSERIERDGRPVYGRVPGFTLHGVPKGASSRDIALQERYRRAMERAAHAQPGERERGD